MTITLKIIDTALVNLVALGSSQRETTTGAFLLEENPETVYLMAMAVEETNDKPCQRLGVSALDFGFCEVFR